MRDRSLWTAWMPAAPWGSSAWRLTTWQLGATLLGAATALAAALAARSWGLLLDSDRAKSRRRLADASAPKDGCCGGNSGDACGCNAGPAVEERYEDSEDEAAELEDLAALTSLPDKGRERWGQGNVVQPRGRREDMYNSEGVTCSSSGEILPGRQTIYVKTYGCAHNSSDSEFMMGLLRDYGYTFTDDLEKADACVINSCTVKNPSQDSATNLVARAKKACKPVILAGCVPSADAELCKSLEGVSMLSVTQIDRVVEVVEEATKGHVVRLLGKNRALPSLELPKVRRNNFIEIIPISGGCLGNCSYCKTKHARGKLSSYPVQAIVSRALQAAGEGCTEVWLASEDTGAYGIDLGTNIAVLMRSIADVLPPGVMLKLGMTNPPYMLAHIEGVAEVFRRPNVFEFLHVPVQSGSDQVLRSMVREYTASDFRLLVDGLRATVPDLLIATDLICGFPAEGEQDHQESLKLVEEYRFPTLNISQFYPRPGTPAAKMRKLPSDVIKRRSQEMTKLFDSYTTFDHLVGREERVWFSETNDKHHQTIGHTKGYVKVVVPKQDELLGHSAIVRLHRASKWHLEGEVLRRGS